jgi:hypothetical protein
MRMTAAVVYAVLLERFGVTSLHAGPSNNKGVISLILSYSMSMTSWSRMHLMEHLLRPCPGPCTGTYGVETLTELLLLQARHCGIESDKNIKYLLTQKEKT